MICYSSWVLYLEERVTLTSTWQWMYTSVLWISLIVFQGLLKTGENSWSLAELVHAVVLLAHFHALASFVFGSGINPDTLAPVGSYCTCELTGSSRLEQDILLSKSPEVSGHTDKLSVFLSTQGELTNWIVALGLFILFLFWDCWNTVYSATQ